MDTRLLISLLPVTVTVTFTLTSPIFAQTQFQKTKKPALSPAETSTQSATSPFSYVKSPSWLLDLGLTATPGIQFESSAASINTIVGQGKLHSKKTSLEPETVGTTRKDHYTIQVGSIGLSYASMLMSQRIYLGLQAQVDRAYARIRSESTSNIGSLSSKLTGVLNYDTPQETTSLAYQAKPGLWIGVSSSWKKNFQKIEAKGTVSSIDINEKTTSNFESSAHTVAVEVIDYPGHFGFEFGIEDDRDEKKSGWAVPFRLAARESLFVGATVGQSQTVDMSNNDKSIESLYSLHAGRQLSNIAYLATFEYSLEKAISDTLHSTEKTKTLTVGAVMGAKVGMRFGILASYELITKIESDGNNEDLEGGTASFYIARVQ